MQGIKGHGEAWLDNYYDYVLLSVRKTIWIHRRAAGHLGEKI